MFKPHTAPHWQQLPLQSTFNTVAVSDRTYSTVSECHSTFKYYQIWIISIYYYAWEFREDLFFFINHF